MPHPQEPGSSRFGANVVLRWASGPGAVSARAAFAFHGRALDLRVWAMRKILAVAAGLLLLTGSAAPVASAVQAKAPPKFKNCKAMQAKYKNGVGLNKATDFTNGKTKPVMNFRRDYRLYLVNAARDGDKDGVACERRGAAVRPPKPTQRPEQTPKPTPTASPTDPGGLD